MSAPSGAYIAVPVDALRLIFRRYIEGDTNIDEVSDQAVIAVAGALNRYDDHDGESWPAVHAAPASGDEAFPATSIGPGYDTDQWPTAGSSS